MTSLSAPAPRPSFDYRTPGRPFAPGTNSHTGEEFQRGEDRLPRGSVKLFYRVILNDKRVSLYRQICRGIDRSPKFAAEFLERAGDRLEGRPTQHMSVEGKHTTNFLPAPVAPGVLEAAAPEPQAPALSEDERIDLSSIPLPREATVLPPPGM